MPIRILVLFYTLISPQFRICSTSTMRDSQSAEKQYVRYNRQFYNQAFNPARDLQRKKSEHSNLDSELIEKFYIGILLQAFQKNEKIFPNPYKILESIKTREKRIEELERTISELKQKLKDPQYRRKLDGRTDQIFIGPEFTRSQSSMKKTFYEQNSKLKVRFIPILQQSLGDSQLFIRLTAAENQRVPEVLFECVSHIINSLKIKLNETQQKAAEKLMKKFQNLDEKYQKQMKDFSQLNSRLTLKLKDKQLEILRLDQQRKKMEKQKNELHTQIYKNHQAIVEKSNTLEQLRQKYQGEIKKVQNLEKVLQENKRTILRLDLGLKDSLLANNQFEQKNRQLCSANEKFQRQTQQIRRNAEQLSKNLSRIRSEETLTSLRVISESENSVNQVNNLKQVIKRMQTDMQKKRVEFQSTLTEIEMRERTNLQKIINQWRSKLEKFVEDHDQEENAKDSLILALQRQNIQLKREIQLRAQMEQHSRHA